MIPLNRGESPDDFPKWDMEKIIQGVQKDFSICRPDIVEEWAGMVVKPATSDIMAARLIRFLALAYKTPGHVKALLWKCPGWIGFAPKRIDCMFKFWTVVYDNWYEPIRSRMDQDLPLFAREED